MKSICFLALFAMVSVAIPSMKNFTAVEMMGVCLIIYIMVEMIKCGKERDEK